MTNETTAPGAQGGGTAGGGAAPGQGAPSGMQNFFDGLRRSPVTRSDDRWAGGVCAGLAERMCIDPVLVRVVLLVIALVGGVPAILYGLAWLALPDRQGRIEAEAAVRGDVSPGAVVAGLLVLFGGLLPRPWQWWWPGSDAGWGDNVGGWLVAAVLAVGALIWFTRSQGGSGAAPLTAPQAPPPDAAVAGGGPTTVGTRPDVAAGPATAARPVAPARRPGRPGPGPVATSAVGGLALLAAGGAALWSEQAGWDMPLRLAAATAAALVLGLAMVWLGVIGRTDGAIGFLGVSAALLALVFALVPTSAQIRAGDAAWTPRSAATAQDGYVLLFGDGSLDLSQVPVGGRDVVVPVRMGFGSMHVTVPDDVPVTVRSRTLVGTADEATNLPRGWTSSGSHTGVGTRSALTWRGDGGPGLVVEVQGLVGDIAVRVAGR